MGVQFDRPGSGPGSLAPDLPCTPPRRAVPATAASRLAAGTTAENGPVPNRGAEAMTCAPMVEAYGLAKRYGATVALAGMGASEAPELSTSRI